MKTVRFLVTALSVIVLLMGCRPREKGSNRFDGSDGGAPLEREGS